MIANNNSTYSCIHIYNYIYNLYSILQFFQSDVTYIISLASHNSPVMWKGRLSSNGWRRKSNQRTKWWAEARNPGAWLLVRSCFCDSVLPSSLAEAMSSPRGYCLLTHLFIHFMNRYWAPGTVLGLGGIAAKTKTKSKQNQPFLERRIRCWLRSVQCEKAQMQGQPAWVCSPAHLSTCSMTSGISNPLACFFIGKTEEIMAPHRGAFYEASMSRCS